MTEEEVRELRRALIRAAISALPVVAILGLQWWITTPVPEREGTLQRFGIARCSAGRWHVRGYPHRCLCRWHEGSYDERLRADLAERAIVEGEK